LLRNLRRLHLAALAVSCAATCAVTSKLADGLARKLSTVGFEISAQAAQNAVVFEELLELGIPTILIFAACLSRPGHEQPSVTAMLESDQHTDSSGTMTKAA